MAKEINTYVRSQDILWVLGVAIHVLGCHLGNFGHVSDLASKWKDLWIVLLGPRPFKASLESRYFPAMPKAGLMIRP